MCIIECRSEGTEKINDKNIFIQRAIKVGIDKKCKYLCLKHYNLYVRFFELREKYCCDPINVHKTKISKNLTLINFGLYVTMV